MKKDDMIKHLIENGEFTKKELNKMKVEQVQELFDERFSIEYEDDDFSEDLEITVNVVEEDIKILEDNHGIDAEAELIKILEQEIEKTKEEVINEEIVVDITKLSPMEQRAYRRTGILPQITINRYTRFDDETPKMNN